MINSENEPHERDTSFVASLKDAIVNVWENASEDVHKLADSFLQWLQEWIKKGNTTKF